MGHSHPVAPTHTPRIFGLDALRAAAILSVTFAHFFAVLYPHVFWLGLFGHGGYYGVELFFVLSGFLIGEILIRAGDGLGHGGALPEFYVRRWFRTLPLFWLLVVINVLLDRWQDGVSRSLPDILQHALFARNFTWPHLAFLPESWSLAVEEWFYLLFPAVLWLGLRLKFRFDHVLIFAALGFYTFSTMMRLRTSGLPEVTWDVERIVVIHRFDAIMVGVLAAWVSIRFNSLWRRSAWPAALVGIVLLIAMYATLWRVEGNWFTSGFDSTFARVWRFNLVSLGCALLLPAASGWTLATENFGSTSIRKIALWSYAIYLIQHPVSRFVVPRFFRDSATSSGDAWGLFTLLLVATIGVSALLHYTYEAPCTRLRQRVGPTVRRIFQKKTDQA